MRQILRKIFSAPVKLQLLALSVFLIGMHSLILGTFIYFFTELFYRLFFKAGIENYFFVKQSGLFLLCMSFFYLAPLADLKRSLPQVIAMILTKILAVLFLLFNAHLAAKPEMILIAASLDFSMVIVLMLSLKNAQSALNAR